MIFPPAGAKELNTDLGDDIGVYLEDGTILKDDRVLQSEIVTNSVVVLSTEPPRELLVIPSTPDASPVIQEQIKRVEEWNNGLQMQLSPTLPCSSAASSFSEETSSQRSSNSVSSPPAEQLSCGGSILRLPDFTSGVREALIKNESAEVWSQVITQTVDYYRRFYPDRFFKSEDYRLLGQIMFKKYPSITRFGKQPWSAFTAAVSARMRSIRHKIVAKRKLEEEGTGKDLIPKSKRKLDMVANVSTVQEDNLLSTDEYDSHKKEMELEMKKENPSVCHVKLLMDRMRSTRVAMSKKFTKRIMFNVIKSAPALSRGDFVLEEFKIMKGWTDKDVEDAYTRVGNLVDEVKKTKTFKWSTDEMVDVMALRYLESFVGFKKGRGGRFKHCIDVKWEVDDERISAELEKASDVDDSPKLVIFSNSENVVLISCVGDNQIVNIEGVDVRNSLLILISLYYILDLNFPRGYSQFLGVVQEIVVKDKFKGNCSGGMIEWMSTMGK